MNTRISPQISVIMSVHNGEKYIARALLSLLAQNFVDFEIILIDDGSTDATAEIVSRFKDDRLKFISQDNIGLTKTLNKALELASGEWIARHDADDFSIWNRFAEQLNFLDDHPEIKLLGSNCFLQPERHGIINEIYDVPVLHEEISGALAHYNPFVHGSMMIAKEALLACGGYNENYRYVQDYELWTRLVPMVKTHNLATPLYVRSVHAGASEVNVNKAPIFNEIRETYIAKFGAPVREPVRPIRSIDFYPLLSARAGLTQMLSETFQRMARLAWSYDLPYKGYYLQGLCYCPWFILNKKNS